jgi:hypothetical protein
MTPLREVQNDEEMIESNTYPLQNSNEQNSETTGLSQVQEPVEREDASDSQTPPYPYPRRPLPGRWNYNSAESAND